MLFDTKTPSHLLAWRAVSYHLLPLSVFSAGYVCDPSLRLWSSPTGHLALIVLFDLLLICTLMSLMALMKAWKEDDEAVMRKMLILPLFVGDLLLTVFAGINMYGSSFS